MIIMEYNKNTNTNTNLKKNVFWNDKPIMNENDFISTSNKITNLNEKYIFNSNLNLPLPNQVTWNIINNNNSDCEKQLSVVCDFLNNYYYNNCDYNLNINFNIQLLKFILGNDGFILSIVSKLNNALCCIACVGFTDVIIYDKKEKFANVNFICSHPKYRKKGIAETMMNELIRYINIEKKTQQGFFISNKKIHQQMKSCSVYRKYMRPLNYKKLHDTKVMKIEGDENIIHNKFSLTKTEDESIQLNYIDMTIEHIDDVYILYNKYTSQLNMSHYYTKKQLENILLNNNIVKSFVIKNDGKIIDFISYCQIEYKNNIRAGHIFLYSMVNEYSESLMRNLIKIMSKNGIDIIITNDNSHGIEMLLSEKYDDDNCESEMETYDKIYENKFVKKTKNYINLFNWACPFLSSDKTNIFIF
jgi:hypothetical protein